MVKMVCARCGKEIEGTTYYTINIYAADINPKTEYTVYAETAIQNTQTNMLAMFNAQKHYCKDCKLAVEEFVKGT